MDMEVEPLEVKSKWSEKWKEMPCKPNKYCPQICSTSPDDCTFPRHKKIQLAVIYVSMDQQVKLTAPNLQQ
jgi:hypothetical protein